MGATLAVGCLVATALVASTPPATAAPPPPAIENGRVIPNRYIVVLRNGVDAAGFASARGMRPDAVYGAAVNGFAVNLPEQAATALRRNPNVLHVEPDRVMTVTAPPTGIDRIDVDENVTAAIDGNPTTGASDIDVAVLDTGVDTNHPDLDVAGGAGFAGYPIFIWWACDDGTASFEDGHGHGTHVAGTIAALDDGPNSGGTDVVGVVPGARIHGVKVLTDSGQGATSCIIDGIDWVTQQKLEYQSSGGASGTDFDVANMSLGGGNSSALCAAVNSSVAAGIVYAVAAGNDGQDASFSSPANCSGALTVSAIADFDGQPGGLDDRTVTFSSCTENEDDSTACFTNDGSTVEVAAPGVSILSTLPGGGYGTSSGTSMASPHVAGAVALFSLAGNAIPDASGPAVIAQMTASGWTVEQSSACGFTGDTDGSAEPLIYVGSSCTGGAPDVTDVAITDVSAPATVNAGETATVDVTVRNEGNQDVTGVNVSLSASDGAVTDSPQTVDLTAGAVTVLSFSWDTTGIAPGEKTLTASHDLSDDDPSDDAAGTTSEIVVPVTDVAITAVSAPGSVAQDDEALVSVTVENEGNQDVSGVDVTLTTTSGAIFGSPQTVDLVAGQVTVLSFTWNTTGAAPGVQTLTASHDLVDDDASDDSASTTSEVVAGVTDVAITGVAAPATVTQGDSAAVTVTVQNHGNQDVIGVNVALAATGGSIIGSPQGVDLLAGEVAVLVYSWDTTGSALGPQTLTATHDLADDDPSDDSASTTSEVTAPPSGVHVADLDASSSSQGRNWTATVTIRVVDGSGSSVSGATVHGSWGSPVGGGDSCTTGASGTCTVSANGIRKRDKSVSWTVTDIDHATHAYDPGSNTDPDGDSNGTTITVVRA